jgi:hypothetical protein
MPSLIQSRCNSLGLSLASHGASEEVMIEGLVPLGSDVRLDLVAAGGERRSVLLSGEEANELELEQGEILFVSRTT